MKVGKLFIFKIGAYDKELNGGSNALKAYYTNYRPTPWEVVSYRPVLNMVTLEESSGADTLATKDFGAYVLGHGIGGDKLGGATAEQLAEAIAGYMKERKLRKVCLVSCTLGNDDIPTNKSFLRKFAEHLHKLGQNPKVAGWSSYVSIIYPGMDIGAPLLLLGKQHSENKEIDPSDFKNYVGHKFVKMKVQGSTKHVLVTDKARRKQKKFVWIKEDGGDEKLTLEDWHDK